MIFGGRPFIDRPLVYIAGPYSHPDPVQNTRDAIRVADEMVLDLNVTPVVPHLSLLWHMVEPHDVEWWYAYDLAILVRCDALYRMPGDSTGADREVSFARDHDVRVFTSRNQLDIWAGKWRRAA